MARAIRTIKAKGDWEVINRRFDREYDRSEYYALEDYRLARLHKTKDGATIKVDARDYQTIRKAICWGQVRCER
jgi:hypothetical protein